MKLSRSFIILLIVIVTLASCQQKHNGSIERPKLVIGLVVDQMRWDYLYRYYSHYGSGGFKRLMGEGYNCQNTMVDYLPSFTGPGHSCIYTGSVPTIHGIAGNTWLDNHTGKAAYCVDDDKVWQLGDATHAPSFSPRNLLVTTITDELRLATNFRSRTYGIAVKDRGSILPAGHTANCAFWFNDRTGDFVTSTYYDSAYKDTAWLGAFNRRNVADSLVKLNWTLGSDLATYTESTPDKTDYEDPFKGENDPVFPHKVSMLSKPDRMSAIKTMPAGNTLTLEMAKACIENAAGGQLGSGPDADFLAISLSSTDYAGHQFAPNALELEDMYMKLDEQIAEFLRYLDKAVGRGNYLLFLTADHGGAHNPKYLTDRKVPAGISFNVTAELNQYLREQFKTPNRLVDTVLNYQVYLNDTMLAGNKQLNRDDIKNSTRKWLLDVMPQKYQLPVSYVIDMEHMDNQPLPEPLRSMSVNGYNYLRSGCLQLILNPGWFESDHFAGTTHGNWNPYDTHIPLLWYGWHIPHGETHTVVNMTDISATLAALLHIQMPNGCIGKPIRELVDRKNEFVK